MFLQWFPSKHVNAYICRHKTVPKHHVLKCFQFPCLPKPLKIPLFAVFSSIFPCPNAGGQVKHVYKKSFQNFVFHSAFTLFPVKNMVINTYTFFARKSVQDTAFAVFSMLWLSKPFQNIDIYIFFSVLVAFPLPEAYQNDLSIPSNTFLSPDTQKSSKNFADST